MPLIEEVIHVLLGVSFPISHPNNTEQPPSLGNRTHGKAQSAQSQQAKANSIADH